MAGLPNYILFGFLLREWVPSVGEDGCGNTLSAIVVPGSKLNVGALGVLVVLSSAQSESIYPLNKRRPTEVAYFLVLSSRYLWRGDTTMQAALVVIILLALLAGAVFVGHYGWVSAGDVVMPPWGWLMLCLGVFFTILVGCGLMALVFYSSRKGFDEPPDVAQKKKRRLAK